MSLGQSALAVMALVVITFLVVSANRIIIQSRQDELKGEAYNQAGEIANELINEAMKKKFDDPTLIHYPQNPSIWSDSLKTFVPFNPYTIDSFYVATSDFTAPAALGPEEIGVPDPDHTPFKSISVYNDFDDYNGYQRIVDTPIMTGFVVNCTVSYVSGTNLNTPVNSKTYYKRLLVKVSQPIYLPDTLFFSTIMTY